MNATYRQIALCLLGTAVWCALPGGCGKQSSDEAGTALESSPATDAQRAPAAPVDTSTGAESNTPETKELPPTNEAGLYVYIVRGRVAQLPEEGKPWSAFMVQHEPIPNFVGRSGQVVGMNTMTMPFSVAEGVALDGLSVGDPIEMIWEVGPGHKPMDVVKITELPVDTKFSFELPPPHLDAPPDDDPGGG